MPKAPSDNTSQAADTSTPASPKAPVQEEEPTGSFQADTLYSLLTAEIAGNRYHYDVALGNYLIQAHKTRDAGVAERATRIALFISAHQAVVDASSLWVELEPENLEARQILALGLIKVGRILDALDEMQAIQNRGGKTSYDYLAIHAQQLPETERSQFVKKYDKEVSNHPSNPQLLYGKATLLKDEKKYDEALAYTKEALKADPEYVQAKMLIARIYHAQEQLQKAIFHMSKTVKQHPDSKQAMTFYARLLISAERLDEAKDTFSQLVEKYPNDNPLRLSLALTCIDSKDLTQAKHHLNYLAQTEESKNEAYFYLGRVAEKEKQPAQAIEYYRQVQSSRETLSAKSRIAYLLTEQDELKEARAELTNARHQEPTLVVELYLVEAELLGSQDQHDLAEDLLTEALNEHPNHVDLLYTRAMMAEKQGNLDGLERDLKAILEQQPENATALNALGYTLTNRTERHEEALELIEKALKLKPNDPAIIDSMGWVHFKLGQLQEALKYIQRAFELFPDPEVASHLIEIWWSLGEKQKAKDLGKKMLQEHPDNDLINQVLTKLSIKLS